MKNYLLNLTNFFFTDFLKTVEKNLTLHCGGWRVVIDVPGLRRYKSGPNILPCGTLMVIRVL